MAELNMIDFIPKWFRENPLDEAGSVPVAFGTVPDQSPKIVTRLIPKDHGYSLTARTLRKVIELKQNLILYSARDIVEGFNPDFADLRTLKDPLVQFATLMFDPSESGSFILPAHLEASPLATAEGDGFQDTSAILGRFHELLASIDNPKEAASISIGALLTCKELGRLLERDVESIEWSAFDRENCRSAIPPLTHPRTKRVEQLLEKRKPTQQTLEAVNGQLTSLDTVTNEFRLSISGQRQRVKGTVMAFHMPWMRERLGQTVELEGIVERRGNKKVSLTVHRVVEGDDA